MKVFGLEKKAVVNAFVSGGVTVTVYGPGKKGFPLADVFVERGAKCSSAKLLGK